MEFLFRSDWTVADSGDACVLEKGQLDYSVRIIKNDILEETGEQVRGFAPIGIVEWWKGGMMGSKEFCLLKILN